MKSSKAVSDLIPPATSPVTPRLLRIVDAAQYLYCTYGYVETIIREKTVPSFILGKRRLIDIRDLDSYIERLKTDLGY